MYRRSPLAFRKLRHLWQVPGDSPPTPTIASVSPSIGVAGGTVTITGTGFKYPNSTLAAYLVTAVQFGGVKATSLQVLSATTLTCVLPSGLSGAVSIRVIAPGGQAVYSGSFEIGGLLGVSLIGVPGLLGG